MVEQRLAGDVATAQGRFWPKVRRLVGRVPFLADAIAAYFCATDPSTPTRVRAVLLGAIVYFIVPTDLVPDFLAGIGYGDDASVLFAAISTVRGHIKPAHRERAAVALARLTDGL